MGLGATLLTSFVLASRLLSPALAAPAPQAIPSAPADPAAPAAPAAPAPASGWWYDKAQRQAVAAFGQPDYKVFRNVKEYGARGDGTTDDTEAINKAIADGARCGQGCSGSTTTPGLIYIPSGTYLVSKPIVMFYYTQLIGDASSLPVIKAAPGFKGMAVLDSNPYDDKGSNFWVNQNNFFRQVRNFVIDLTAMPETAGAGIHWQVSQATSLQNIHFKMIASANTKQIGVFQDNGSPQSMSDLTFEGGEYGFFAGAQQFTVRNMTFRNCKTAVFANWNWLIALQDITIENCGVGIDMANGDGSQTVGSVMLMDSVIRNTPVGVLTSYKQGAASTNGTLILDNVDMTTGVANAVAEGTAGKVRGTILAGGSNIASFVQGRTYSPQSPGVGKIQQGTDKAVAIPDVLKNKATGKVFTRSKPQYLDVPLANVVSVKSKGAKGDGKTDDTQAIQAIFDAAKPEQLIFFDHGAYIITDTVKVPKNIRIAGEIWPYIMASGPNFQDQTKPRAVFQVGQPGDVGSVEMSDLMFETKGPAAGAVLIEWNVREEKQGSAAMWDVHVRIGGSAGTELDYDKCKKAPNDPAQTKKTETECLGAFLMLHVTEQASAYIENCWYWVADHHLEPFPANHPDPSQQINVFSGRGVLVESQKGPVWMWGTASEHSVLYNYQTANASNVYMSSIQTETPYFQGLPEANTPFAVNANFADPDFDAFCAASGGGKACRRSWGLRVVDSKDVYVYGAGLYSFFENYGQSCLKDQSCQEHMVSLERSPSTHIVGLSTKAATNMLTVDGKSAALDKDNRNNFCATLALFSSPAA
ncbi:hypothetical protein GGTG_02179 [Gaeumannomyces tritici R3-111a-1]|uniref:Rhamnogalacturonase A/B/Epimerase-like pectate lyase domain-containing protein n=1 Tax=Gaeumannomyces tritici (strain R3-111a-1) TaxID=644352 RepID=J3NLN0_GAET3|nr:hypothetical protein GGTG_02179 [Gaeumannomyces tritici R3-111a-1]EJT82205.1 hypothetical protein GGTG_02179 [Gaeumannomyces tritici R3-111a-1]